MPLTGKDKAKYQKEYMKTKRSNKGLTDDGSNSKGLTEYPAIIHALADPIKRKKLEKITQSLKDFNQEKNTRYGVAGPSFDVIGELLEATR